MPIGTGAVLCSVDGARSFRLSPEVSARPIRGLLLLEFTLEMIQPRKHPVCTWGNRQHFLLLGPRWHSFANHYTTIFVSAGRGWAGWARA